MKLKTKKQNKKKAYKSRYQVGGMYSNNTVSSAAQGNVGNTSNIVYKESDPRLQEERIKGLETESTALREEGVKLQETLKQDKQQSEIDIQNAKLKSDQKVNTISAGLKSGVELGKQSGLIDKKAGSLGIGNAISAYKGVRAAKNTVKGIEGFNKAKAGFEMSRRLRMGEQAYKMSQISKNVKDLKIGTDSVRTGLTFGKQGSDALSLAKTSADTLKTGADLTSFTKDGYQIASESTKALANTSALGSAASALNNANVYALAANYAGKGIKSLADDDDATTWTAGEATGDTLSKAGEFAGYGAMVGSVVPGVGNAVGAGVGAVIGTGVGIYQGLTGRKKARKAEAEAEAIQKKKVGTYNESLTKNYGMRKAAINVGAMRQKEYSGYDLGRNVVARKGGMRMGMPRYGYAA